MARRKQKKPQPEAAPEQKKRRPSQRIIHKIVLDDEGRPVCPRCKSAASTIDDYHAKDNGVIQFIRSCECGARYAVEKHVRFIGSPYLDRLPEPEEVTYVPDPQAKVVREVEEAEAGQPKRRKRRTKKEEVTSGVLEVRSDREGSRKVRSRGGRRKPAGNGKNGEPAEAFTETPGPSQRTFRQTALPGVS